MPANMNQLISKIKSLQFPLGQYVVVGSGIMSALGIRESRDIDIAVMPELHDTLRATKEWKEEERYNKIFLNRDNVEIIPKLNWEDYTTTTEEAISSAIIIEGVPFMNLEELKKFKKALGREKDLRDINQIDEYLLNKK